MVIPSIPWWLAFAIGLPLGVLGYFGQAYLVGRRARRAALAGGNAAAVAGPSSQGGPSWGPTRATEVAAPAPTAAAGETEPMLTTPGPSAPAEGAPDVQEPVKPARRQRTRYGKEAAAPKPAAATPEAWAPDSELVPVNSGDVADRRRRAATLTQLRKRERYLEDALDLIVGFVDGDARRARARACAKALDEVLPKTRRSPELKAFLQDVEGGRSLSDLQDDAEQVGVQLAIELKEVKTELLKQEP